MARINWTPEELYETLELYCLTPFGRLHSGNPERVVELAHKIGRTPSAVALKMTNFASLDPSLPQKGMANSSKLDREVWHNFFGYSGSAPQSMPATTTGLHDGGAQQPPLTPGDRIGEERFDFRKGRINQDFFRQMVLANFDGKCALTGIEKSDLLVAGHILPWATHTEHRLNPHNGICLNSLHDRAFEKGLIAIAEDNPQFFIPGTPVEYTAKA